MTVREIAEYIGGTRRELLSAVEGLSEAQLNFRPAEDRWSAGQLLHHVALTERRIGRKIALLAEIAQQQGVDPPSWERLDLSFFGEIRRRAEGKRFQAPPEVAPPHGTPLAEVLAALAGARQALLESLPLMEAHDMSQFFIPHPVFGEFNVYQWLFFMGAHERRHREQIEALKKTPEFPQ